MTKSRPSGRIRFLDEFRGVALLGMVVYHTVYDLFVIFGVGPSPFEPPFSWLQQFVCWSFILISGVSCRLSHSNLKRGLVVLGAGMLMTFGTMLFMPDQLIRFGVLHFLGVSMLLYPLLRRAVEALHPVLGVLLFFGLFLCLREIPEGTVLFGTVTLPAGLYRNDFTAVLGFPPADYSSADYFPLLPWFPLFLTGAAVGKYFKDRRLPAFMMRKHSGFLCAVGGNTLFIYLVHQPVIYGILYGVFRCLEEAGLR
ncbi:MAG TPA: heparan-alpha-glucosaminide N-acetyltransferase [Oscillospiraceae bacterium]|nr:DUF1624 domain-containing protein [Oscillospiraceae bacterium]HNW04631.1 heparan-alpha-glucosaminide N-acetyltransferase [Oscillospiraceae bacterium]